MAEGPATQYMNFVEHRLQGYLGRQKLLLNLSGTCIRCKNSSPGETVIQSKSGRWWQETERKFGHARRPAPATADSLTADSDSGGGDSGLLSWAGADVGNERINIDDKQYNSSNNNTVVTVHISVTKLVMEKLLMTITHLKLSNTLTTEKNGKKLSLKGARP